MAFDKNGDPQDIMSPFTENVRTIETALPGNRGAYVPRDRIASLHDALVLGIRDYVRKCGFQKAVVGLSGGIDSSLVCSLAAEALGKENITGITMPSKFSSRGSVEDSMKLSSNLGIEFLNIPISGIFDSCMKATKKIFAGKESDKTEENLQARIRGSILMAFSNKFGHLPLSTGNKSELAVGYCTLYGDMSGGLAVISDVPKTAVYKLAEYINRTKGEIIPQAVFRKPPSAELKSNQTDQDTLPPYDILDRILEHLIEEGMPAVEIARNGFNKRIVDWTVEAVKKNEYKRKQAPLGLKVTPKAFGSGRRMPIAAKY
jgi:NAD+ synthase (glutamine-hydrolysing)